MLRETWFCNGFSGLELETLRAAVACGLPQMLPQLSPFGTGGGSQFVT